jgi:hypothetical protein
MLVWLVAGFDEILHDVQAGVDQAVTDREAVLAG